MHKASVVQFYQSDWNHAPPPVLLTLVGVPDECKQKGGGGFNQTAILCAGFCWLGP